MAASTQRSTNDAIALPSAQPNPCTLPHAASSAITAKKLPSHAAIKRLRSGHGGRFGEKRGSASTAHYLVLQDLAKGWATPVKYYASFPYMSYVETITGSGLGHRPGW